jgi:two-component system, cell cycle sensor histidine kinase and response regulator CckA
LDEKTLADKLADSERLRAILEEQNRESAKALLETGERLQSEIAARKQAEADLLKARAELALRVEQRTAALASEIAERSRAEEGTRARVHQQEKIVELGLAALAGMDLPSLMDKACYLVTQTLGVEYCKILELLPDGNLILRAGAGWKEGCVGHVTVSGGSNSQAGFTLLVKEPVIVEDLLLEKRFNGPSLLREHGVVSGMSVIIRTRERPFGVLGAHTSQKRTFVNDDIHFIQAIANTIGEMIERRQSEETLSRSDSWLRSLIATTQDAVVSIDRRGCVVLFNPAAERIFGYGAEEIAGKKVNQLMAEPYASEHDSYIVRYERTGEARAIGQIRTVIAKRKNGEQFPIELSVTEIDVDEDVHYAAFIRDISEKSELQARLVENERLAAIGMTAAKIAHELNNPLNGMSLTVQLLEQRLARQSNPDSQAAATVKRLKNEISRLNQLAGEFRTISRKEKYDFRRASLARIIEDLINLQASHLAERGIEIESLVPRDLPAVSVDTDKMKQALLNLIKNSAEAMPNGGKITFEGFSTDDAVVLEIADTGTGIPLDIDAFEPFATTKKSGTGLGLFIVRQIVTAHRGKISYRSRPGVGTTFRIDLPLSKSD